MDDLKMKAAAPIPPVGASGEQPIHKNIDYSIAEVPGKINPLERAYKEKLRKMQQMTDPAYLHTISMRELYENVYQSKPPVIDGLLYAGTYLFAGAPKVGKSFLVAQIAYFDNHGGYEFAKQFYTDAYKSAIEIVGGEQYILSAVMHADERNRAMSESLERDVYHYHLHVVYIPVVEKQVLWSKRCKDKSLVGTVKETITQVSSSKKWKSHPAIDEQGKPILQKSGKPVLRKSYSVLQDDFFNAMRAAGYTDIERGERGSSEEHLTVTQFKMKREQERLAQLQEATTLAQAKADQKNTEAVAAEKRADQAKIRLDNIAPLLKGMEKLAADFSDDPERTLPEPGPLETARAYREKKVKPLWKKIVKVLRSVYRAYFDLKSKFEQLQRAYDREVTKNSSLSARIQEVCAERDSLKGQVRDYERVRQTIGPEQVSRILEDVCQLEQAAIVWERTAKPKIRVGAR